MHRSKHIIAVLASVIGLAAVSAHGAYTVERVTGGLNQPMFVTQSPGDGTSLFIVERNDGGNQLGRIRQFNLQTQTFSTFLDVTGNITDDGGLLSMAFHPEYQSNGLFYVTSNVDGSNRLDEYKAMGGAPLHQRRLLQYQNLNNVFHTINQPFFRPNGNNNELFVTTGDGGTQADDPDFDPALIESLNSPYGKLMRFNLSASYPTPADGPSHPGVDIAALGLRNPYRSGFDRQTGDFYLADVGFLTAEEVNFIPASHFANPAAAPLDFGWTDREGTVSTNAPFAGGPGSPGDLNPIFDYAHGGQPLPHPSPFSGQSITGGYVYRGPIQELQGRYFFSDFVNGNVYSGSFDASTNPTAYNGTNLTGIVNHTSDFEAAIGGGANIQFLTSFSEDNAGNLYMVKFGNSFFPPLGQGELFRISPVLSEAVAAVVDRDTGALTLTNSSGAPISFTSLSLTSSLGAIDPTALTPVTGNYDSTGNGAIDDNNPWSISSPAGSHALFAESTTGDAGSIDVGEQISLSPAGGWIRSPHEDLFVTLLVDGTTVLNATVSYVGNGGEAFRRSDLDFNDELTIADWSIFSANSFGDLSGLSPAESYALGDLDGDGDNDYADFRLFKEDFDAANGAGALAALTGVVPEPSGALLISLALTTLVVGARFHLPPASGQLAPAPATRSCFNDERRR